MDFRDLHFKPHYNYAWKLNPFKKKNRTITMYDKNVDYIVSPFDGFKLAASPLVSRIA